MAAENNIFSLVDLNSLPSPDIVEMPEFVVIKAELVAKFVEIDPRYQLLLESDPVMKVIELWAYRELIMRARINEAARANLLAKASGSDLDQLAAFYNVARLLEIPEDDTTTPPTPAIYEDDESLRYRVQVRVMAWANAGGADHYRYWALSASPDVLDVAVYSPDHPNNYNMGGHVAVSVLSRLGDLVPSADLVAAVRAVVMRPDVKVVSDIVVVSPAVMQTVNIAAEIKLLPQTPIAVFNALAQKLITNFGLVQRLGWDVTRSWLIQQLQVNGVHSVNLTSPAVDVTVAPNNFPSFGTVVIHFAGYADQEADDVNALEQQRLQNLMYDNYIAYAVANKRGINDIVSDLPMAARHGVTQPSLVGLAKYLGIVQLYKADRVTLMSAQEIATLVLAVLSPQYAA